VAGVPPAAPAAGGAGGLRHVVVGAGEAGTRAAIALAARSGEGHRVVLVGEEADAPYERPPLSKAGADGVTCKPIAADGALAGVKTVFGVGALALDRAARVLRLADGRVLAYDRLLLATGARPRRLSCPGGERAAVLRTRADAERIFAAARPGARAVIVGAGLIGLELAATLRGRGLAVTVIEAAPRALGRALPGPVAEAIVARHRAEGVTLRLSAAVERIDDGAVVLRGGEAIAADLVVAAIGVEPEVGLAKAAGLACDDGILVDGGLRTSDPAIFAAGDCARLAHPRFGPVRFETWRNACDMGAAAAGAMAGEPVDHAPGTWFWSDHYDLGLQMAGRHDGGHRLVRRDLPGGFLLFGLDEDGRLATAAGIGPGNAVARDVRLAEMLIEQGAAPDPALLADPAAGLKTLLARG